jgi:hypothetical protein
MMPGFIALPPKLILDLKAVAERKSGEAVAQGAMRSIVDEIAGFCVWRDRFYASETLEILHSESGGRFDFDYSQFTGSLHHQIHFVAFTIPKKIEVGWAPCVVAAFQAFNDDEIFENLADQWIPCYLVGCADAEQKAE